MLIFPSGSLRIISPSVSCLLDSANYVQRVRILREIPVTRGCRRGTYELMPRPEFQDAGADRVIEPKQKGPMWRVEERHDPILAKFFQELSLHAR